MCIWKKVVLLQLGKSYTTSSHWIPQGRNTARVFGCSGAIWVAYPFFVQEILLLWDYKTGNYFLVFFCLWMCLSLLFWMRNLCAFCLLAFPLIILRYSCMLCTSSMLKVREKKRLQVSSLMFSSKVLSFGKMCAASVAMAVCVLLGFRRRIEMTCSLLGNF